MSSFVTNNNTRRTKRARVHNVLSANETNVIPIVGGKTFQGVSNVQGSGRNPGLTVTQIGSHNSKGIMIVGSSSVSDFSSPTNPDDLDIPLSSADLGTKTKLSYPAFPIGFSGPGYLEFQNELSIPFVTGNTSINGNVTITGNVTVDGTLKSNLGSVQIESVEDWPIVIEDSAGASLDGLLTSGVYETNSAGTLDYFEASVSWTGKTLVGAGLAMRVVGFPYTNFLEGQIIGGASATGIYSTYVGADVRLELRGTGLDGFNLKAYDSTRGVADDVLGVNFLDTGSLHISGILARDI